MVRHYNIIERRLVDAAEDAALVSIYTNPDDQEMIKDGITYFRETAARYGLEVCE